MSGRHRGNCLELRNSAGIIQYLFNISEINIMAALRVLWGLAAVLFLCITPAAAAQLNISAEDIAWYFQILELYILPLLVVSTILLLSIYGISRVHGRFQQRRSKAAREQPVTRPEAGTAAFLKELKATPPIQDPEAESDTGAEPVLRSPSRARRDFASILAGRAAAARQASQPAADELRYPTASFVPDREPPPFSREDAAAAPLGHVPVYESGYEPEDAPEFMHDPEFMREPVLKPEPELPSRLEREFEPVSELQAAPEPEPDLEPEPEPEPDRGPAIEWPLVERSRRAVPSSDREAIERSPLSDRPSWWPDSDGRLRIEPAASAVVEPISDSAQHSAAEIERAAAMAKEITAQLDYITTILQQCVALLADHIRARTGLDRDEVQSMRISGFESPQDVRHALQVLGQDVVDDVVQGYDTVKGFNHIVGRLRQMAESQPLDEGWNDLIRARLSQTIYAIGRVRKSLAAAMPKGVSGGGRGAEQNSEPETEGNQADELRGMPFGRRQG